jgi:hypothetical protein
MNTDKNGDWKVSEHSRGQIVERCYAESQPNIVLHSDSSDHTWTLYARWNGVEWRIAAGVWPVPTVTTAVLLYEPWYAAQKDITAKQTAK